MLNHNVNRSFEWRYRAQAELKSDFFFFKQSYFPVIDEWSHLCCKCRGNHSEECYCSTEALIFFFFASILGYQWLLLFRLYVIIFLAIAMVMIAAVKWETRKGQSRCVNKCMCVHKCVREGGAWVGGCTCTALQINSHSRWPHTSWNVLFIKIELSKIDSLPDVLFSHTSMKQL